MSCCSAEQQRAHSHEQAPSTARHRDDNGGMLKTRFALHEKIRRWDAPAVTHASPARPQGGSVGRKEGSGLSPSLEPRVAG